MLHRLGDGDPQIIDRLLPIVYQQLKSLAHRRLWAERAGHTLNTTALVHEAYIKLVGQNGVRWSNRAHFMAIASQAMRRILIDYARARQADKRGGGEALVTLNEDLHGMPSRAEELILLDKALQDLKTIDERQAQIVTYHFFGGLTHEEIGEVIGVSVATVRREWRSARAWLGTKLRSN